MRNALRLWVQSPLVVLLLLGPVAAGAQTPGEAPSGLPAPESPVYAANEPGTALKQGKVLRAFRIVTTPPEIDGLLTDEAWTFAESAGNYVQRDPDNGEPMTEASRIQVAYDDRYVYVAILCEDSAPAAIASGLGRRDEFPSTDYVSIGFDPRHDHLTGYVFQTNPSSVQGDQSVSDDDRFDRDYNAVWEVRALSDARGWSAEFRIPFSQMRFTVSPQAGQVWGFQAERWIRRKGEKGTWVGKPRGERGEVSLFGHLVFDTHSPLHGASRSLPTRSSGGNGPTRTRHPALEQPSAPTSASGSGPPQRWPPRSTPTSARWNRIPRF